MAVILTIPTDAVDRFMLALSNEVARDDASGIRLVRSRGRRASGRNRRYWLMGTGRERSPRLTAASDAEAVDKANRILNS